MVILELAVNSLYLSSKRGEGLKQEVDTLKEQLKGTSLVLYQLICGGLHFIIVVWGHCGFPFGISWESEEVYGYFTGAQAAYVQFQDEVSLKATKEEKRLADEVKSQKEIIFDLRQKLEQAQVDVNSKEKELKSATTNLKALEKQTEGFQNEYMRVLDDNENLRIQLSLFDRKYASSGNKKNS